MSSDSTVLVLGSGGLVGSSIVRTLKGRGYKNILTPSREDLDLFDQNATQKYFSTHRPDQVYMAAAKVGGIIANNQYRADFIHENLVIQANVFGAAFKVKTPRVLFLGSSCIYPRECPQPMKEQYLLSSALESTNEPYAIAKIAGLKTAQSFRQQYGFNWFSVMPTNLYGPNDNFDADNSHVIPGLIARMYKAQQKSEPEFEVWGSGNPRREFLFVDDLADACEFLMKNHQPKDGSDWINVGSGSDVTIKDLALKIAKLIGFEGTIKFNTTKPDGTLQKLLDSSQVMAMGWSPKTNLDDGLTKTIEHFNQRYL